VLVVVVRHQVILDPDHEPTPPRARPRVFADHYNSHRPHRSLGVKRPDPARQQQIPHSPTALVSAETDSADSSTTTALPRERSSRNPTGAGNEGADGRLRLLERGRDPDPGWHLPRRAVDEDHQVGVYVEQQLFAGLLRDAVDLLPVREHPWRCETRRTQCRPRQ
jgi:hypothetical protein